MAVSLPARAPEKTLGRSADLARLSRVFHALSDETRLQIVGKLLTGEKCVCELSDALDTGQSRLSFHLKALKEADLVSDRRTGRWVHYALRPDTLSEITRFIGSVREGAARCC
jgi:ArsR family transcriptional regulator, arsenate/arsenite/antimonite-responsive transcriptional repressor